MPLIHCNGVELYYEVHGSGAPLLLIAGLASDSQSWLPVVPSLAEHFTVILMDNRGVGRSERDCEISISLMADDSMALLQQLGFEKATILGHSMGGMAAMESALRYPEIVSQLVLVATAARNTVRNNEMFTDWADWYERGDDRSAWFRTIFCWILTERFFEDRQLLDASLIYLLNYPWPQSPASFRKQVEAISCFDFRNKLSLIQSTACVIAGGNDLLFPLKYSEELATGIPDAELVNIPEAAHSIHSEYPKELIHKVMAFCMNTL